MGEISPSWLSAEKYLISKNDQLHFSLLTEFSIHGLTTGSEHNPVYQTVKHLICSVLHSLFSYWFSAKKLVRDFSSTKAPIRIPLAWQQGLKAFALTLQIKMLTLISTLKARGKEGEMLPSVLVRSPVLFFAWLTTNQLSDKNDPHPHCELIQSTLCVSVCRFKRESWYFL